jgi:hypothetical protein
MTGGVSAAAGVPAEWQLIVGGTWVDGDLYTINLLDTGSGFVSQIGAGFVTGQQPIQVQTFNNKVYLLAGASVFFSGVDQPITWNDPNGAFNGFITLSNYFASTEDLVAMAPYQGRLAFFSRWTIQIFITDPNPINWTQAQVLPNMGTLATNSVQSLGDLDVLFLSDTGFRSLRVRDESLYAFINDLGSPIDLLVQANLQGGSSNSLACGVVDPSSGQYWCFLNSTIYVLAYFPSAKITAWSMFSPTYVSTSVSSGFLGQTLSFTPVSMCVFQGQVYILATSLEGNVILQYGGDNATTYDTCQATVATSWMDLKDPGTRKKARGFDGALNAGLTTSAQWTISAGMDELGGGLDQVFVGDSTFELNAVPFTADGYHIKIQAVSTAVVGPAVLSSLIFHYLDADEK